MANRIESTIVDGFGWKSFMSYAGWVIGFIGTLATLYLGFVRKDKPQLEYDILSATNFINNHETSANLKIFPPAPDFDSPFDNKISLY